MRAWRLAALSLLVGCSAAQGDAPTSWVCSTDAGAFDCSEGQGIITPDGGACATACELGEACIVPASFDGRGPWQGVCQ